MQAAVITDFIQGIFVIILSFLLCPYLLEQIGGFTGLHQSLPPDVFGLTAPDDPPPGYDRISVAFVFVLTINTLFNIPGQPHCMEMGGSGKTEWEGRVGFTYGNMIKRFCTIAWAFIGVGAMIVYPNTDDPELVFGMATRDLLPIGLIGVMLASMLASVMSSCDSFMVAGSALFVENIYKPYFSKDREDNHFLYVGRLVGIIMVVAGILVTEIFVSVVELWRFLSALPAFWGIVVWGGLLWRRCNGYGAWAGLISSALVWWITRDYFQLEFMHQVIWYLSTGVLMTIIVSLRTAPQPKTLLDKFYTTLHTPIGQEDKLRTLGYEVRD